MIRAVLVTLAACLAPPLAAANVLEQHEALAAASDPATEAALADLRAIAGSGDSARFLQRLAEHESTLPPGAIGRERVLAEGLRLALALTPSDTADAALSAWAQRQPETHVWLREGGHQTAIPVYDVGAAARSVQRHWAVVRARDVARATLDAGSPGLLDAFAPGAKRADLDEARDGVALAIRSAERESLFVWQDAIVNRLRADQPVTGVALAAFERLQSPDLALALAEHGDPSELVHHLPALLGSLDAGTVSAALDRLLARPQLASAALIACAPLAATQPVVKKAILARLEDRALGASAALALARIAHQDPGVHAELRRLAGEADTDLLRQRARLALDLHASTPAAAP